MKGMKKNTYDDRYRFNVGARVEELCSQRGITKYRVSVESGISEGSISKWKSGEIKSVGIDSVERVCFILGVTLHEFFNDDMDQEWDKDLMEICDMCRQVKGWKRRLVKYFLTFVISMKAEELQ